MSFKVLSDCSMRDDWPLSLQDEDTLHVNNLKAHFKLCCENRTLCTLCVGIDIEVKIHLEKELVDEDHSGQREEDYDEEANIPKGIIRRLMEPEVVFLSHCYGILSFIFFLPELIFLIVVDNLQSDADWLAMKYERNGWRFLINDNIVKCSHKFLVVCSAPGWWLHCGGIINNFCLFRIVIYKGDDSPAKKQTKSSHIFTDNETMLLKRSCLLITAEEL